MAPPRKSEFPAYGCLFCTRRFATEIRCGQHLDEYVPEYRDAYRRLEPINFTELHPEAVIRASRRLIPSRGTLHPILWKKATITIPDGVSWNFVVPITTKEGLTAYLARPLRSTEDWIAHLGAIVLPAPVVHRPPPLQRQVLPAEVQPAVAPRVHTPPVAALSVAHRGVGPNMAIGNSSGVNNAMLSRRRRRIETPSPPTTASIYDIGEGATSPTPVRRKKTSIGAQTNVGATTLSLAVNARNLMFDFDGDINASQDNPGRANSPIVVDDDDDPRAAAPTPVTAAASRAALMAEFFTPGNDAPNFFQVKIVGTEFCVSVGRATTLSDVLNTVQRRLLDPMGYPLLSGLRGQGEDACWDERSWAEVKLGGARARALYVMAEMDF